MFLLQEYISSRDYTHRDVAARNILLKVRENYAQLDVWTNGQCLKIADFGLCRPLDGDKRLKGGMLYLPSQQSVKQMPYRWLPPESNNCRRSSEMSDV